MARPVSIRDEDLLEAARTVFLEKGVRTTTAEVAERAGVSEGILFKRFGSKEKLFQAAMQLGQIVESVAQLGTTPRAEGVTIEAWIEALGSRLVEAFRVVVPVALMSWSNHFTCGELPQEFQCAVPPPVRAIRMLTAAFEREMKAGSLRRANAELVARTFIGSLWHFVFLEHVLKANSHLSMSSNEYVRETVSLFMQGLHPARPAPAKRSEKTLRSRTPSPSSAKANSKHRLRGN